MTEWQPSETAPKNGTLLLLLVDYSGEDGNHWIDDEASGLGRTIGHNNDDNVGEGEGEGWQFAGWCWSHDHYVEGTGRVVGWQPLPQPPSAAEGGSAVLEEQTPGTPRSSDDGEVERLRKALRNLYEAERLHDPDDWHGEPAMIEAWELLGRPGL